MKLRSGNDYQPIKPLFTLHLNPQIILPERPSSLHIRKIVKEILKGIPSGTSFNVRSIPIPLGKVFKTPSTDRKVCEFLGRTNLTKCEQAYLPKNLRYLSR